MKSEKIKKDLEKCRKEKEEYLNGWKRAKADFLNYKKEETERFRGIVEYSSDLIILDVLSILDNFEIAEKQIPEDKKEEDEFIKGLLKLKIDFNNFLKNHQLEEIDCLGKTFNPELHEAVELVEEDGKSGKEVEEVSKGYMRKGRLLRAAKVKVIK